MLEKRIRDLIDGYLAREVDQAGFAQEFAGIYFQARNDKIVSLEVRQICASIVLPFAEFSRGHRSEASFREVLTQIARPFGPRIVSIDSYSPPDPYAIAKPQDVDLSQPTPKPPAMAEAGRLEDRWIECRRA